MSTAARHGRGSTALAPSNPPSTKKFFARKLPALALGKAYLILAPATLALLSGQQHHVQSYTESVTLCPTLTASSKPRVRAVNVVMDSEWLREGIRIAFKSSLYDSAYDASHQPPEQDPRLRELIEKIHFSRRLILTYHLVVLSFILVLSALHWTQKVLRWRRRRLSRLSILRPKAADDGDAAPIKPFSEQGHGHDHDLKATSSSGNSTMAGDTSSPQRDDSKDEETPLLGYTLPPPIRTSILFNIKALLIYQPRPIPFVNKTLPSNGTSIAVLSLLALNLFYIFYDVRTSFDDIVVLADRLGLVFCANIPLLYLLAAKNQPIKFLTGRSYESLLVFHRRLGELLCLEGFFHAVGFLLVWYALFKPTGFSLLRFLLLTTNFIGLGMLFAYELIYFTSLSSFRQRWYELFLGMHIVFQILALLGLYFHHSTGRPYALAALIIVLLDRLVYRIRLKSMTISAQAKILEDEETVKLSSPIVLRARPGLLCFLGDSLRGGWQATDHVFITAPSLSRTHILQAHPFTIASAPPRSGDLEVRMELIVRARDGFSRDLLNAARLHKEISIRIDGPYGSSHARSMLEDSDLALIVAGGSGIAVSWPLVQHLLAISCPTDSEIAKRLVPLRQKIILIWVIHESAHLSWLGREALAAAENQGAEIIVPRATEEIGRPDLNGMIKELVDLHGGQGKTTSVVTSGPDGMGRLVRNTCAELLREGKEVNVAVEKFGW